MAKKSLGRYSRQKGKRGERLLDEDERATQKRVSANNCERVTVRAFTYSGECYQQAEPLA